MRLWFRVEAGAAGGCCAGMGICVWDCEGCGCAWREKAIAAAPATVASRTAANLRVGVNGF
jgi:hypothetical protein